MAYIRWPYGWLMAYLVPPLWWQNVEVWGLWLECFIACHQGARDERLPAWDPSRWEHDRSGDIWWYSLDEIRTWISNNIHCFRLDIITHPCHSFNRVLSKLPAKRPLGVWHWWIITSPYSYGCNYLSMHKDTCQFGWTLLVAEILISMRSISLVRCYDCWCGGTAYSPLA